MAAYALCRWCPCKACRRLHRPIQTGSGTAAAGGSHGVQVLHAQQELQENGAGLRLGQGPILLHLVQQLAACRCRYGARMAVMDGLKQQWGTNTMSKPASEMQPRGAAGVGPPRLCTPPMPSSPASRSMIKQSLPSCTNHSCSLTRQGCSSCCSTATCRRARGEGWGKAA